MNKKFEILEVFNKKDRSQTRTIKNNKSDIIHNLPNTRIK
jgi:hypothetical protein